MTDRAKYLNASLWFLTGNFVVCLLINLIYLFNTPDINSFSSGLFAVFVLFSNNLMFYMILALLVSLFIFIKPSKITYYIINLLLVPLSHLLLFADATIYKIFKFHINGLVINLLMTEGSGDSVHLGKITLITFIFIVLALYIGEFFYLKKLSTKKELSFQLKKAFIIIIALIFIDKGTYAVSDLFAYTDITSLSKAFPLYQPLTIKRTMKKWFGIDMAEKSNISIKHAKGSLNYPKNPLINDYKGQKPNIMIFVLDAWRFDMFNADNTPNIWKFSQKSFVFHNHYSGGNASRFGGFSILYGLNAFYWQNVITQQQSSVLTDEMIKNNYLIKILSSTKLTYPEFRRTAFVKIPQFIEDELPGTDATTRDPELARRMVEFIKTKPAGHFFTFGWLDAPHGPYSYTNEYEKYTPSEKTANYITVSKNDITRLKNSYKNAIYFDDAQMGKIIDELESSGVLKNTIVIITADHGEEFREMGYFGHTSAFTPYQTHVPLIMHIPDQYLNQTPKDKNIHYLTSHVDIIPTIFDILKYKNPHSDYSQGKNLLDGTGHKYVISSGWNDAALIDHENTFVFSLESYNASRFEVRDSLYKTVGNKGLVLSKKRNNLQEVMQSISEFLK